MAPLLGIVCGSPADRDHANAIAKAAAELGMETSVRIASAHRTPEHALAVLKEFDAAAALRPVVLVTVAGRSNALSGFADPQVSIPVIACPPPSDSYGGADVWSSLRMPAGVGPLVSLDPVNAALAAAKIVGLVDASVRDKVAAYQANARARILAADAEINGASA